MLSRLNRRYPRVWQFWRLARLDRPVGTLLLLWPTLTALWIAAEGFPGWHLFLVFSLGTLVTRSAGCIANDLIDMDFDGHVARTRDRPLVTGEVAPWEALVFAIALLFLALLLVMTTNLYTQLLAVLGVMVAVIYPYMKRFTYMPQGVLGVAFSWGIPMAFTATGNQLGAVAWLLFLANLLWVIAYDSFYAMVDQDDDLKLGLKSSALLFGRFNQTSIIVLQLLFLFAMLLLPLLQPFLQPELLPFLQPESRPLIQPELQPQLLPEWIHLSIWYYLGLGMSAGLFAYQHYLIRKSLSQEARRQGCFKAFLNNQWVGFCIFAGAVAQYAFASLSG